MPGIQRKGLFWADIMYGRTKDVNIHGGVISVLSKVMAPSSDFRRKKKSEAQPEAATV